MKLFFVFLISLLPSLSIATKVVRNGGDLRALEFTATAYQTIELLERNPIQEVEIDKLRAAVEETSVESTADLLFIDEVQKDAINYPELKKIVINHVAWDTKSSSLKVAFVLHEYLGIMGIDDSKYQISKVFSEKALSISGGDGRILMRIFAESRILAINPIRIGCTQLFGEVVFSNYRCILSSIQPGMLDQVIILDERRSKEIWNLLKPLGAIRCDTVSCKMVVKDLRCRIFRLGESSRPVCSLL